jgi:hypothetical protein
MIDFYLPLLFIILALTYQMCFYLFYKYYQIRKENLGLNKFLIAFGLLYGFGFTGIVVRAFNSYFVNDLAFNIILNNASHILISIAAISFLLIISLKDFKSLLNSTIIRIIIIIAFVASILIMLIEDEVLKNLVIFSSILIGVIFMIYFHVILIQNATGNVKVRILILFIGELLVVIGIVFGTEKDPYLFTPEGQLLARNVFTPLIILGQLIIFYAFYDFPVFLEFKWQENLDSFYVIDKKRLKLIYNYNFRTKSSEIVEASSDKNVFFSRGLIGIESIISLITKTKGDKIQRINQEDQIMIFNYGTNGLESLIFCIIVDDDMVSMTFFLKVLQKLFQNRFKLLLNDIEAIEGRENIIFDKFKEEIDNLLIKS